MNIACSGHITLGPEMVRACIECGHPTDKACITCAKKHADADPMRGAAIVDCTAIAEAAVDKSPVCPCCIFEHSAQHTLDEAFGEARAQA